ncbi:MAG: sugar transferase [Anaerolineales bacterium]|nr:sugar transferase [Anaerolineales bacterium]
MVQHAYLDLVRQTDPTAVSPLVKDRVFYYSLKRLLELSSAAIALVILSPLFVVIAVLIILDTGLPIFFTQNRVGARRLTRGGYSYWQQTTFPCYKFRTMVQNADDTLHREFAKTLIKGDNVPDDAYHQFKTNDPRVTQVGTILRKTCLNELPQFVNVLKGEMSLVGPRPILHYELADYQNWHKKRLACLPGITGLWQVRGHCGQSFDYMIRQDIEYIRNQSLQLDFKILFLTIPTVLSIRGAG